MRWAVVLPVMLLVASCDDVDVHILTGQLYVPQSGCIEPSTGVDVVNGPSTGDNCSPQCLVIDEGDGAAVYITTVCPPYPGDYTVEAMDATTGDGDPCVGAFAAYEEDGGACGEDAGAAGDSGGDAGSAETGAGDAAGDGPTGG